MSTQPLTVEEFRDLIHNGELNDPLLFLESLMSGQDPRKLSDIYKLVSEIEEFSEGAPSKEDWSEVVDMVMSRYKFYTVTMSESAGAAKTLAEYLHAKRKHVEMSGGLTSNSAETAPLTEEEILLFKEKFNENF